MNAPHLNAALALLLLSGAAGADDLILTDRARLPTMSRDEYLNYREQLHSRADNLDTAEQRLQRETAVNGRSRLESGYGQGYAARNGQPGGAPRDGGRRR